MNKYGSTRIQQKYQSYLLFPLRLHEYKSVRIAVHIIIAQA